MDTQKNPSEEESTKQAREFTYKPGYFYTKNYNPDPNEVNRILQKENISGKLNDLLSKEPEIDELESQMQLMDIVDVATYRNFLKEKISVWHDEIRPDYIIMTDASSVPIMIAAKAAWKAAYPSEKPPVFLRAEPWEVSSREKGETWYKDFKDAEFEKLPKDAKILLFDEWPSSTERRDNPLPYVQDGEQMVGNEWEASLGLLAAYIRDFGFKNIWADVGLPELKYDATKGELFYTGHESNLWKKNAEKPIPSKSELAIQAMTTEFFGQYRKHLHLKYQNPVSVKDVPHERLEGGGLSKSQDEFEKMGLHAGGKTKIVPIPKGPLRDESKKFIHDLKLLGKSAGEILKRKLESEAANKAEGEQK